MAGTLSFIWSVPELRNQIYEYAREAKIIHLKSLESVNAANKVCHQLGQVLVPADLLYPHDAQYWAHSKRQFLGLTQVCRQLRHEFRPLYQASTQYSINSADLNIFLDTFTTSDGAKDAHVTGHVKIQLLPSPALQGLQKPSLNLLPLMKLCHQAAAKNWNFHADFERQSGRLARSTTINKLLYAYNGLAWPEFVNQSVTRFATIGNAKFSNIVTLWIRRAYFEDQKAEGLDTSGILGAVEYSFRGDLSPADEIRCAARADWERSLGIELGILRKWMVILQDD